MIKDDELERKRYAHEQLKYFRDNAGPEEPHVCKRFGCGRTLRPIEKLFSLYCFNHIPLTSKLKTDGEESESTC